MNNEANSNVEFYSNKKNYSEFDISSEEPKDTYDNYMQIKSKYQNFGVSFNQYKKKSFSLTQQSILDL